MNSLIIGNTSQLSYYFPEEYERISSRNVNFENFKNKLYDRVFLTFAEQRIHENISIDDYYKINHELTLKLINFFKNKANYIIVYGSCELWNNYIGEVDLNNEIDYEYGSTYSWYCQSKHLMINHIYELGLKNVIVLHPFNFNSVYRKSNFLFYNIFDSIINKKKIEIGDTYFYRDLIHPKYVVERSMNALSDEMVGSGRLTHVNDFIRKLYIESGLNYEDYVTENINNNFPAKKKILYLKSKCVKYNTLVEDTLNDIHNLKIN